jgi:hypothetical protein
MPNPSRTVLQTAIPPLALPQPRTQLHHPTSLDMLSTSETPAQYNIPRLTTFKATSANIYAPEP